MKTFAIAAVAALFATAPAVAADFAGPRAEVRLGYDSINLTNVRSEGFSYGVSLGYDFQVAPNVTVGPLVSIDLSNADVTGAVTNGKVTQAFRVSAQRDIELGGRIATNVADNINLYAKASYANLRAKGVVTGNNFAQVSETNGAFRAGAGIEVGIGSALYTSLGYDHAFGDAGGNRNRVLAGVGFRF